MGVGFVGTSYYCLLDYNKCTHAFLMGLELQYLHAQK